MKFTLDRIEENKYVFLKQSDEKEELIISVASYPNKLSEGDIVEITYENNEVKIEVLKEETKEMKSRVEELLTKLKNKNL